MAWGILGFYEAAPRLLRGAVGGVIWRGYGLAHTSWDVDYFDRADFLAVLGQTEKLTRADCFKSVIIRPVPQRRVKEP